VNKYPSSTSKLGTENAMPDPSLDIYGKRNATLIPYFEKMRGSRA